MAQYNLSSITPNIVNTQYQDQNSYQKNNTNWAEYSLREKQVKEASKQNKVQNFLAMANTALKGIETYDSLKSSELERESRELQNTELGLNIQSKRIDVARQQQQYDEDKNFLDTTKALQDNHDWNKLGAYLMSNPLIAQRNKEASYALIQQIGSNIGEENGERLMRMVLPSTQEQIRQFNVGENTKLAVSNNSLRGQLAAAQSRIDSANINAASAQYVSDNSLRGQLIDADARKYVADKNESRSQMNLMSSMFGKASSGALSGMEGMQSLSEEFMKAKEAVTNAVSRDNLAFEAIHNMIPSQLDAPLTPDNIIKLLTTSTDANISFNYTDISRLRKNLTNSGIAFDAETNAITQNGTRLKLSSTDQANYARILSNEELDDDVVLVTISGEIDPNTGKRISLGSGFMTKPTAKAIVEYQDAYKNRQNRVNEASQGIANVIEMYAAAAGKNNPLVKMLEVQKAFYDRQRSNAQNAGGYTQEDSSAVNDIRSKINDVVANVQNIEYNRNAMSPEEYNAAMTKSQQTLAKYLNTIKNQRGSIQPQRRASANTSLPTNTSWADRSAERDMLNTEFNVFSEAMSEQTKSPDNANRLLKEYANRIGGYSERDDVFTDLENAQKYIEQTAKKYGWSAEKLDENSVLKTYDGATTSFEAKDPKFVRDALLLAIKERLADFSDAESAARNDSTERYNNSDKRGPTKAGHGVSDIKVAANTLKQLKNNYFDEHPVDYILDKIISSLPFRGKSSSSFSAEETFKKTIRYNVENVYNDRETYSKLAKEYGKSPNVSVEELTDTIVNFVISKTED